MQKVFVMYKLRPGVSIERYMEWSRTVDQVITPFQPGIQRFEVYRIKGAEKGQSPYDIVEDMEVDSWEAYQETVAGPGMARVVKDWNELADPNSAVVIFGDKIK